MTNFLKANTLLGFLCFSATFNTYAKSSKPETLALWYNQPAKDWKEALPIGNGSLNGLLDVNHAYLMYQELAKSSTLNNLFNTHPPFQIDGNFGATSGVSEMLLQSHLDKIQLPPSLPDALANGAITGLVARGNFVADMKGKLGILTTAAVLSRNGGACAILSKTPIQLKGSELVSWPITINQQKFYSLTFETSKGKKYYIVKS